MGFGSKPGLLSVRMAAANPGKKRSKSESSNSKSRSRYVVFTTHVQVHVYTWNRLGIICHLS